MESKGTIAAFHLWRGERDRRKYQNRDTCVTGRDWRTIVKSEVFTANTAINNFIKCKLRTVGRLKSNFRTQNFTILLKRRETSNKRAAGEHY